MANIESLNIILGRLLNGYMNTKELETGKLYREWTNVIDIIRIDLNKIRIRPDGDPRPLNALGDK